MAVVIFNSARFKKAYPQFAAVSDEVMEQAFDVAALFVDNSERASIPYNPATGARAREILLSLLVCHLLTLAGRGPMVGNMTTASEGSVSAGFALPALSASAAWFAQTPCGLTFWQVWQKYALGGRFVPCRHQ